jgi:hypothetical protein
MTPLPLSGAFLQVIHPVERIGTWVRGNPFGIPTEARRDK